MTYHYIVTLALILILSLYINFNLYRKILHYENIQDSYDKLLEWFTFFRAKIEESETRLVVVDKRGGFSSDDEVGFLFKEIRSISQDLKAIIDIVEDPDDMQEGLVGNATEKD